MKGENTQLREEKGPLGRFHPSQGDEMGQAQASHVGHEGLA